MRTTIHAWGFVQNKHSDLSAAICRGSVLDVYESVRANLTHFGHDISDVFSTRTLDGWLVAVEFTVSTDGDDHVMWHRICQSALPWAQPTEAVGAAGSEEQ